jgi:hypothetical protein
MPGRHASPPGPRFYRDLLTMMGGILVVAIVVYLGLTAFSTTQSPGSTDTTAAATTMTTIVTTTTGATTTSTTLAPTTSTTTTTIAALRAPNEIQVRVLNGVGIAGLASQVSGELQEMGYQMLEPGDYSPALSQSRVWYVEGFEGEAFELAAEFPDALVERASAELGAEADIVVVLGDSYDS